MAQFLTWGHCILSNWTHFCVQLHTQTNHTQNTHVARQRQHVWHFTSHIYPPRSATTCTRAPTRVNDQTDLPIYNFGHFCICLWRIKHRMAWNLCIYTELTLLFTCWHPGKGLTWEEQRADWEIQGGSARAEPCRGAEVPHGAAARWALGILLWQATVWNSLSLVCSYQPGRANIHSRTRQRRVQHAGTTTQPE